jgi:hypothetical protein
MGERVSRLPWDNNQELLYLAPLLLDGSSLLLLNFVVELEFLLGLVRLAKSIVSNSQPIVSIG